MSVQDQGIGISEQDLPHIFTPFYRSKEKKNRLMNSRGHGLGLYICKQICESLGGEFTVVSALNIGSKFTMSINLYEITDIALSSSSSNKNQPLYNISDADKSSLGSMNGPEETASLE